MSSSWPPPPGQDPNITQPFPTVGGLGPSPQPPPWTPPPNPASKPPKVPRPVKAPKPPRPVGGTGLAYGNLGGYLLRRLLAFLIDVPGLAFVAASFAYGQLRLDTRATALVGQSSFPFIGSMSLLGALVFAMLCEGVAGTTLGKALFMLHVYRARGGYAGLGRAIVRAVLRPIDLLAIGPLLAAATPRHQRLGDFAAGTSVARSPAGALAPVVSLVLLAGLGYAQFAIGGGLDSAMSVAVQTTAAAPVVKNDVVGLLGFVIPALKPNGTGNGADSPFAGATATPTAESPATGAAAPAAIETPAATGASPTAVETLAPSGAAPAAGTDETPSGATFPPEQEATPAAEATRDGNNELTTPVPAESGASPA